MNAVQPPARQALLYRPLSHSQRQELSPRHYAVLPLRQRGDLAISATRSAFAPYSGVNADLTG
jgi:hypothetical protein